MPRVTKKQKELGVKSKPKPKGKAPVVGTKFSGVSGGKGKGFKVGPSHAARNSYIGKAQKKKAELIEAAKIKKQYAKVLAAEGMKSARVGGDVSARDKFFAAEEPTEASDKRKGKGKDKDTGRAASVDSSDDEDVGGRSTRSMLPKKDDEQDESDYMSDSSDDGSDGEGAAFARAMRARIKDKPKPEEREKRGGKAKRDGRSRDEKRDARKPYARPEAGSRDRGRKGENGRPAAPRVRALSRSPPPAALPPRAAAAEFREKKREAFAKRHVGRAKGQPNMAARMGVLLEKIKRDSA